MSREIDEGWVAEAIARHRRIEARRAEFDKAVQDVAVTVRSADGTVEVVVSAAGEVRDVTIRGSLAGRTNADLSHAVRSAVVAAARLDAAAAAMAPPPGSMPYPRHGLPMRLRQLWGRALAARGREAELLAAALGDTAAALRAVAAGYADSDAAATRRLPRREP